MATPNTIHVDIVSAEGEIFSGAATMVFAPGSQGELGIAPRHAPLLTLLKAGEVRVQTPDGSEQHFFVGGGALEIQPNKVTVLADTALRAKDLTKPRPCPPSNAQKMHCAAASTSSSRRKPSGNSPA